MFYILLACVTDSPSTNKTDEHDTAGADTAGADTADTDTAGADTGLIDTQSDGKLSYAADIEPLVMEYCAGCHYSEPANLPFADAYDLLIDVPSDQLPTMVRVRPGDAEQSYLWHKLAGTHLDVGGSGFLMPKPPYSTPLSEAQIELFRQWIVDGAKP